MNLLLHFLIATALISGLGFLRMFADRHARKRSAYHAP